MASAGFALHDLTLEFREEGFKTPTTSYQGKLVDK